MNLQGDNIDRWVEKAASRATRCVIVSPFFRVNTRLETLLNSVHRLQVIVGDEFSINDPGPLRRLSQRVCCDVKCIVAAQFGRRLHAKVFYVESSGRRQALVGSANFTVSGLTKNKEQAVSFDSCCEADGLILDQIERWIDELEQSAGDIDWERARRQYETSPDPNSPTDGFDTYLRDQARNFWVLKTTAGRGGDCYWPDFLKENVIAIGWTDIVRIVSDEQGLEPHEFTYEELHDSAVQWFEEDNRSAKHAATMLHLFSGEFSKGDRIIVCNGYPPNQQDDVHLYGLAVVDGDAYDDSESKWWHLKRPAVLKNIEIYIPKEVFVSTLERASLLQTIHRISEQQYERFTHRCRQF